MVSKLPQLEAPTRQVCEGYILGKCKGHQKDGIGEVLAMVKNLRLSDSRDICH